MSILVRGPEKVGLFLHIPKTGGVWLSEVAKSIVGSDQVALCSSRCGNGHHSLLRDVVNRYDVSFSMVRHPVSWYESWWSFQAGSWVENSRRAGWWSVSPTERCASDDFDTFVRLMLKWEPGFVSRMYEWYLGPPGRTLVDIVGRYEELHESCIAFLRSLGIVASSQDLEAVERKNVSLKKAGKPVWDPELRDRVVASEMPAILRWYDGLDESGRYVGRCA